MEKARFTIGVDVSRNSLDIYCIEVNQHICISNNSIGFKAFCSFCKQYLIDLHQTIVVLEYTGGYEYKLLQFLRSKKHRLCSYFRLSH